jgi:hypothetical protein
MKFKGINIVKQPKSIYLGRATKKNRDIQEYIEPNYNWQDEFYRLNNTVYLDADL